MASYTLILGTKNWSSWSLRAYLAMRATGAAFEEVMYALDHSHPPAQNEELRRFSPAGRVPVLKIDDGATVLTVWDSLAICETLAERHPEADLWPKSPRLRAQARALVAEMHAGFPHLRDQLSMDFARTLTPPPLRDATRHDIARIQEAWSDALATHGGPFLCGAFSIVDAFYAPVVSRFCTYGVALPPPLEAYGKRMMELPAMQDWLRASKAEIAAGLC